MTTRYYHTPPSPASSRARCPVCHEVVYSRAGIHPQCAVRQADPPRPKGKAAEVPGDPGPGVEADVQVESVAVVGPPTAEGGASTPDRPPVAPRVPPPHPPEAVITAPGRPPHRRVFRGVAGP